MNKADKNQKITLDIIQVDGNLMAAYNPPTTSNIGIPVPGIPSTDYSPTPGAVPVQEQLGWRWARWGENDRWPTTTRLKIENVPIAGRTINQLVNMLYGNGIAYYRNSDLGSDPTQPSRAYIPAIENWLRQNRIHTQFITAQFQDFRYSWNAFSELVFSKDRKLITNIYHKTAEHCRLSQQDENELRSLWLLYSPDFAYQQPANERIRQIPLYQWDAEEEFMAALFGAGFHKMAWHSRYPTAGNYYARPYWMGLFRDGGWIDASIRVPEVVNAMMKNQIILKYQVLIPEDYFRIRHQNWDNYTDEERNKTIDTMIGAINSALKGEENAFTSIATVFKQSPINGEAIGKVEIIAVDDKLKKDEWVPSSETADAQIVQGLGLHPSQVGLAPQGGKMGAGSGSDQREAFNTAISTNNIEQQICLEPLNWIAQYNRKADPENWDITFFIDHTMHTTTNAQESGLQPSPTTLKIQ